MAKAELIKARELIEAGWVKSSLIKEIKGQKCYCLDGALAVAHGAVNRDNYPSYIHMESSKGFAQDAGLLVKVMPQSRARSIFDGFVRKNEFDEGYYPSILWNYNDDTNTRKQDVLDLLDRAISLAVD